MNEKFYIDGEAQASIEFQGIEDSLGFSWGYPPTENIFPLTGYWPFMQGAMAYRFFINDAISFEKSLRVDIGFGPTEKAFHDMFSKRGSMLQLSSVCYWYQTEPHVPFAPLPPAAERAPAPEKRFWPEEEPALPTAQSLRERKVRFLMLCGHPEKEIAFAEPGFGVKVAQGYAYSGWPPPVYHCRADENELRIELTVPKNAAGTLRLHLVDPDSFAGGRRERVFVGDRDLGEFAGFQDGKWLETRITADMTREGALPIRAVDLTEKSNAVISIIEWVGG